MYEGWTFLNFLRRQTCKSVQYVLGYNGFKSLPSFSMTLYESGPKGNGWECMDNLAVHKNKKRDL
jgi:hypothetical protein